MTLLIVATLPAFAPAQRPRFPDETALSGMGVQTRVDVDKQDGDEYFSRVKAAGFRWIREDITWTTVEPLADTIRYRYYDKYMAALDRSGLRAVINLNYGNPLYQGSDPKTGPTEPESRAAFARFASQTIARYKGRGIIWEVWNEPDWKFWRPKADPAAYARLVEQSARAIRAVAPNETIAGPALSSENPAFLEAIFKLGVLEHFDAVTVHPYTQKGPEDSARRLYDFRRLVHIYSPAGKRIPVLASEWGYTSAWAPAGVPLGVDGQATFVSRVYLTALMNASPLAVYYDWQDDGDDANELEHRFGLTRRDGSWKNGIAAISAMASHLAGYRYAGRLAQDDPFTKAILFKKGKDVRILAWRHGDESMSLRLPGAVSRFGRQGMLESTSDEDPASAQGFDPGMPDRLSAAEVPVLFTSQTLSPEATVLGALPSLPATFSVWDRPSAERTARFIVDGLKDLNGLEYFTLGEHEPQTSKVASTVRFTATGLGATKRETTLAAIAQRLSRDGFRLLRLGVKVKGARLVEIETLLR